MSPSHSPAASSRCLVSCSQARKRRKRRPSPSGRSGEKSRAPDSMRWSAWRMAQPSLVPRSRASVAPVTKALAYFRRRARRRAARPASLHSARACRPGRRRSIRRSPARPLMQRRSRGVDGAHLAARLPARVPSAALVGAVAVGVLGAVTASRARLEALRVARLQLAAALRLRYWRLAPPRRALGRGDRGRVVLALLALAELLDDLEEPELLGVAREGLGLPLGPR